MTTGPSPVVRMHSSTTRARLMVPDAALIIKRCYFLQRELVLMQAGWLPGMVHWESKLLLPEFLWQDALIAAELRQRVLELRYPEREIDMNQDQALVMLFRHFRDAPNSFAFAEGLLAVAKPMLREAYQAYLDMTDTLDDGPTVRILRHAVDDIDEQLSRWSETLADARTWYPEMRETSERWLAGLAKLDERLGDLLDTGAVREGRFDPAEGGGKPFSISRRGARDRRFNVLLFPWPDALDPMVGAGEEMQLQVRQGVHHLNEIWAAEMAGACLFDLAEQADSEFLTDAARWCYDEIRHCRMGYTRLQNWGFDRSEMPLGSFSYDAGAEADALTRLGIIFYFESTYIHTKSQRMKYFSAFGDRVSSHDMDFDWADEQIHAHYGTRWLKYFLEKKGDPRRPVDFRAQAEAAVTRIRENATPRDREETKGAFETLMTRARELAQSSS